MPPSKRSRRRAYPGHLERRGDSYRVILRVDGERHAFTLNGVSREQAESFAREKHDDLAENVERHGLGLPGPMRFSEFLAKYERDKIPTLAPRSQRSYRGSLDRYREFFVDGRLRDPLLEEVRSGHVSEFLTWRRTHRADGTGTASARTVQKDRAVLHAMFSYAAELGLRLREGNPVSHVKRPRVVQRDPVLLTTTQYERLLDETADHPMLHLYVLILGETGARCESEALRLKWEDVDLEAGFIFIPSRAGGHRTKSGKGRWVPMTPEFGRRCAATSPAIASRSTAPAPDQPTSSTTPARGGMPRRASGSEAFGRRWRRRSCGQSSPAGFTFTICGTAE